MQITDRTEMFPNQVMALFADSALSFNLSNGATLGDLADRLDQLSGSDTGLPTAVYLKFSPTRQPLLGAQTRVW